jgi:hypothetical protein
MPNYCSIITQYSALKWIREKAKEKEKEKETGTK